MTVRPDTRDSLVPYDLLGRKFPHRMNFLTMVVELAKHGSVPVGELSPIPRQAWSEDVDDDKVTVAVVSCPCEQTPVVPLCEPVQCECDRVYYHAGDDILVSNSPVRGLAAEPVPAAEAPSLTEIEPS